MTLKKVTVARRMGGHGQELPPQAPKGVGTPLRLVRSRITPLEFFFFLRARVIHNTSLFVVYESLVILENAVNEKTGNIRRCDCLQIRNSRVNTMVITVQYQVTCHSHCNLILLLFTKRCFHSSALLAAKCFHCTIYE